MSLKKIIVLLSVTFLLGLMSNIVYSQVPSQAEIAQGRQMLDEKGISEAEVKKRMRQRGYDPDNLDPERIPEYRQALQEVVREIEAEKAAEESSDQQEPSQDSESSDENVDQSTDPVEETQKVSQQEGSQEEKQAEKKSKNLQQQAPKTNIYGHQLFSESQLSLYRAAEDIATPDNYVLSTGDEVQVSIFGRSQTDLRLKINDEGYVQPTDMPKIFLKGLKLKDAKSLLLRRLQMRYSFNPEQFSATLITSRTVTLNIFGEVMQPGSYTISALNTGLNAIMAAGGLKRAGTVRNIKLIKGDGEEKVMDVYEYLSNPQVQFDFPIDDKDILYVPLAQNVVEIKGAVRRPMKYEMKDGETLEDLIEYAGGLKSNAYRKLIQISRLAEENRVLIDLPLNEYLNSDTEFKLRDDDIITIREVEGELEKYVEVIGAVEYPGQYDFQDSMTLVDLIDKAQFKEETRRDLAFLFRENLDNTINMRKLNVDSINMSEFKLQKRDRLVFYSIDQFVDTTKMIGIRGAVREPDTIKFNPEDRIKLADLVTYAGGLKPNAKAEGIVKRLDFSNNQDVEYIEVNFMEALADTSGSENIMLKEGDMVTVYSNEQFSEIETVSVLGEVREPDTFRYDESLNLKEAILLAGGLKKNANNIAIIKHRAEDNNKEVSYERIQLNEVISGETTVNLKPRDVVRIYDKNVYLQEFEVSVLGEVKNPGKYEFDESLTIKDMIYMAGGLTIQAATNQVDLYRLQIMQNEPTQVLHSEIKFTVTDEDEIQVEGEVNLQPYDIIVVRPVPDFEYQEIVYVNGEVKYPGPYILGNEKERLDDVVERAGGLKTDAFPAGATLLRKKGGDQGRIMINLEEALSSGNRHENIVVRNGDVLFVPKLKNTVSIRTTGTLSSLAVQDTAIAGNEIQLSFQGKRSARWYINNFAGGFSENADKSTVRVLHPGGRVSATTTWLWFIRDYPTVEEGSTIAVDLKPPPPPEKEKDPVDWDKFLRDTLSIITSVVTLLVLLNRL